MSAKFECVGQILIAIHAITISWENVALIETTCNKQGDLQGLQYFIASTALAIKIFLLWHKNANTKQLFLYLCWQNANCLP